MRVTNVQLFSVIDGIIMRYYPYESVFLLDPFVEFKNNRLKDRFNKILSQKNIHLENRSTIEIHTNNDKKLYVQFYDGITYIGLTIKVRDKYCYSNSKELNIPFMF